jgi:hypothetical protein
MLLNAAVSYDLFAQAFFEGEAAGSPQSAAAVLDVIRPFARIQDPAEGFWHTITADGGEADFYMSSDGGDFMVNNFSPGETTELIVRAAASGGLVLLGPDLPPLLTDTAQLAHLPDELVSNPPLPVLVKSGAELEGLLADDIGVYEKCRRRLATAG